MENLKISCKTEIIKNEENYFLSVYNREENTTLIKELFFDSENNNTAYHIKYFLTGEREYHAYTKNEIDLGFDFQKKLDSLKIQ